MIPDGITSVLKIKTDFVFLIIQTMEFSLLVMMNLLNSLDLLQLLKSMIMLLMFIYLIKTETNKVAILKYKC